VGYEKPSFPISLKNYWVGEYPVTQALWALVMNDNYSHLNKPHFKGQNHPIEQISWRDIEVRFLPELNRLTDGLRPEGTYYRLPTEIEWEYAAKGGKYFKHFPFDYSGGNKLNQLGWFNENSHKETKPVGLKTPNLLGLYDMCGNVWEWCNNSYYHDYQNALNEGWALPDNDETVTRIQRGGSSFDTERYSITKNRNNYKYAEANLNFGFRLALSPF
jgi:formylglycine-generating enzyme